MKMRMPFSAEAMRSVQQGFTLVELMIALTVALVVLGSAYLVSTVYQHHHRRQQIAISVQQNLTGALVVLEQQIRMAGYDPLESDHFGIVDVRRYDLIASGVVNAQGQPALFFTFDRNEDGLLEGGVRARNREHPNFRIQQTRAGNAVYLSYDNGSGRRPVAGNIQAMGLAYAVDADSNGEHDTWNGGPHVIWAVDSDNDNRLDSHIDTNNDGRITAQDDTNGDGIINREDGAPLNPQIELDCIKAVRVWLLAVSGKPASGYFDDQYHVLGDRVLAPNQDNRLRRVMETVVECRNL